MTLLVCTVITNLREVVSVFNGEQFLELVIDDVSMTSNLVTRFVLATLHNTHTTLQSYFSQKILFFSSSSYSVFV